MVNDQEPGKADTSDAEGTQEDSSRSAKLDRMMPEWVDHWEPTPFEIAHHESEQKFLHKKHALERAMWRLKDIQKVNPDESAEFARLKAELETLQADEWRLYAIDPKTLNQQLISPTERDAHAAAFIAKYGGSKWNGVVADLLGSKEGGTITPSAAEQDSGQPVSTPTPTTGAMKRKKMILWLIGNSIATIFIWTPFWATLCDASGFAARVFLLGLIFSWGFLCRMYVKSMPEGYVVPYDEKLLEQFGSPKKRPQIQQEL
jgi:hypothetical protein